jgi:hypothetical protein
VVGVRFNETCVLLGAPARYQDAMGAWHAGKPEKRTVFCNPRSVGAETWTNERSRGDLHVDAGIRPDAAVQLRTVDYGGEEEVSYRGREYDVDAVVEKGDLTTLTLLRRASNAR